MVYPVDGMGTIGTVIVDGNQLELGSFATSTIFTAGTAVTRNADNLSAPVSVLYPWWQTAGGYSVATRFSVLGLTGTMVVPLMLYDGTVNNQLYDVSYGTNSFATVYVVGGTGNSSSSGTYNLAGVNSLVYSVTPAKASISVNRGVPKTAISAAGALPKMTLLSLGHYAGGGNVFPAHFLSLTLRAGPSTAAQLQEMH
jgi:hypothetical protein